MKRPAHSPVYLCLIDDLDALVASNFTSDATVTAAHDEYPLRRFL